MHLPIGIVISARAWESYCISHELIHQLQQQEFGVLYSFQKLKWYIEGMAYYLSNDPRENSGEPLQDYRNVFQKNGMQLLVSKIYELLGSRCENS